MDKKIYVVEAISMFRHTYYINAKNESDALDEFYWSKGKDTFMEGSQNHLDEIHSNVRELSEEEFLKEFDKDSPYLSSWSEIDKFAIINEIDYEK